MSVVDPKEEAAATVMSMPEAQLPGDFSDKRLDRQQSYQQFHIGLYITISSAIIGASAFGGGKIIRDPLSSALLALAILFLALAGACGGFVVSKISEHLSYEEFLNSKVGFRFPPMKRDICVNYPKTWESFEHGFFWMSLVMLMIFGIYITLMQGFFPMPESSVTLSVKG